MTPAICTVCWHHSRKREKSKSLQDRQIGDH